MLFKEKIEILIRRKGMKKTEFADQIGITYRALANYLSGNRVPKGAILKKIATALDVTEEFLLDDRKNLIMNSEERFIYHASDESTGIEEAARFLEQTRGLFAGNSLTEDDKQTLFTCLSEIYFDAKANAAKKYGKKHDKE